MKNKRFGVLADQSSIDWTGHKVTGSHNGTIDIKEGALVLTDGKLAGGRFIADISSIKILDISDPATNAQFAGHLASEDFFATKQYPEAIFVINSAEQTGNSAYTINGDLTIKGITHPVRFGAVVNFNDEILTASGKIIIDRTLYGIKFRSGNFFKDLGDTLIYNDFDLNVLLIAKAIAEPALIKA